MSEFEEFVRSQGFGGDFQRGCNGQYKSDLLHFMEKAFMHQQAKINAITKQRDSFIKTHHIAMNDVCENKAKIDELQKLRSLDEMAINQLAQANQVWRTKCDELQARVDESLRHVVDHGGYDDLTHVINILKGDKDGRV